MRRSIEPYRGLFGRHHNIEISDNVEVTWLSLCHHDGPMVSTMMGEQRKMSQEHRYRAGESAGQTVSQPISPECDSSLVSMPDSRHDLSDEERRRL